MLTVIGLELTGGALAPQRSEPPAKRGGHHNRIPLVLNPALLVWAPGGGSEQKAFTEGPYIRGHTNRSHG
jgi:hypothetical protein